MIHCFRAAAILVGLMLGALTASAQTPLPPSGMPALPKLTGVRVYVLDCGTIISNRPEGFGVTRDDVFNPNFSDPCFLVMHPKGMLLFDTGLPDSHVGRPIYENMMAYEGHSEIHHPEGRVGQYRRHRADDHLSGHFPFSLGPCRQCQ